MCRFSFFILTTLFLPIFVVFSVHAGPVNDQTFQKIESSLIEIIKPNSDYANEEIPSYPAWTRALTADWLKYNPDAVADASNPDCSSKKWWETYRKAPTQPISQAINEYLRRCDKQIQSGWSALPITGYLTAMVRLDLPRHPYGRFVMLHFPNGNQLKGYLALKGDGVKRPLIVIRLGIFSNLSQFLPEKFMFLQLFEQSLFNVLVLESSSSNEYIFRNKTLAMGGFDEGIQNFLLAKKLQDPAEPISKVVEDVHLAAMSFGGHGAMFASLLSELEARRNKTNSAPVIKSVLTYCPLLNFRSTMDFHLNQGIQSAGFDYWVSQRLHGVEKVIPEIDEKHFVKSMSAWLDKNYQGPSAFDESLPLNEEMKTNLKKFWIENQFWSYYKDVKTPVLILATESDSFVPFDLNSYLVLNKSIELGNSPVQVVPLQAGMHCDLPGSYLWRPLTTIAQSFFLQQSDFKPEKVIREVPLSVDEFNKLKSISFPPKYTLQEGNNLSEFILNLEISAWPTVTKRILFSLKDLGYGESDFIRSKLMVERWLTQNLHFELAEGALSSAELKLSWYR